MAPCPPPQRSTFDVRNPTDCVSMLNELLQAYAKVVSGNQRTLVRFNERWSEYSKANVAELRTFYMQLYTQCPAAKQAGLPSLNPDEMVRRGPAARAGFYFGRL